MEKVTIGIINYNGRAVLPKTLESIQKLNYSHVEVIVADNLSMDGSREWVQENYPEVQCLCLNANRGPAGGRNAILRAALSNYILFLDNDITLEPDTVTRLMHIIQTVPDVAVCHPEICDPNDPAVYHYNGGWIHYLGAYISRNNDLGERPPYEVFDVVSGAAMLVNRTIALEIGGFDEDYFFNWEDGDFVIRLTLAGYLCVNVPQAIAHHLGKARGTSKAFYMVRNRWYFLLKFYAWKTLILSLPALLVFEIAQALLLLVKGNWQDYWKANRAVIEQLPRILQKRRQFKALKLKSDRDWLGAGNLYIPASVINLKSIPSPLQYLGNSLLNLYWRLIRPMC
ncbi:MAG: glycosyltransferase family 2 protein [Oscillatoriales cyanobacterium RM1_1_9]|nr:glycosyltransferase family 2 protein [Oscillatoriales cyanobacterium SM2_3_0]NJO44312.1 glycosyltransferase family 2 protein [Oscillatoriales cyanobacterium RM2_1_1]NJO71266.1 glycosyltransferase family 2 protein [Oscillatoriales cyanobacterium RM1_1_9]